MSDRHRGPDAGMLRATTPLRVRPLPAEEHSPAVAAVVERVRADVAKRRGQEFADWYAQRLAEVPGLLWLYASPGFDPHAEGDE